MTSSIPKRSEKRMDGTLLVNAFMLEGWTMVKTFSIWSSLKTGFYNRRVNAYPFFFSQLPHLILT
jgi:hypothetical protein